jgi:hypothetical protein
VLPLLLVGWLHAAEPPASPAADPPASPAPARAEPVLAPPPAPVVPPLHARVAGEELEVQGSQEVLRKRAELYESLVREGYTRRLRKTDRTVFLSEDPWKPRVIVHDDGWIYFRREPPRIHAPGRSFTDQGSPAAYLLCILAPTSCVSIGGWLVSPRKLGAVKADVVDTTREKVRGMNDAVARRELGYRLNTDIPRDLDAIWQRIELSPEDRRVLLFEYWDSRTDTPEGAAAKEAIESFLRGVVQQSGTPFTVEELTLLNTKRYSRRPLDLGPRAVDAP